jgi:hypothetical protein
MRHVIVTLPTGRRHHGIFLDLSDLALVLAQFDVCCSYDDGQAPELVPTCTPSHIAPIQVPRELSGDHGDLLEPVEPRELAVCQGGVAIVCQPFDPSHKIDPDGT